MPHTGTPPDPVAVLRSGGLRVTGPRVRVLDFLADRPHSTVRDIGVALRAGDRPISVQAIYDVLEVLTTAGITRRLEPSGSAALYEIGTGDNHHHLVCRSCGEVHDVECAGSAPCLTPGGNPPFEVDEAEVIFWGLCADCSTPSTAGTAT